MRLETKHKYSKGKTEKQKKKDKEKKDKSPKISKAYRSMKPLNSCNTELDLTKLTYGFINSCELTYVTVDNSVINLDNSWIELILLMLDTLIENKPDNFLTILTDNNVCNQWFCVDKVYGKYPLDGEIPKVYNIYNSGYYLEAVFSNENIFNAIIGLCKCLGYSLDEIKLNLRNTSLIDLELNYDLLEEEESIVNLYEITPNLKKGIHMLSVSILGVANKVHRIDVALLMICNWIYDNYGVDGLTKLKQVGNTGICMDINPDKERCEPIRGSKLCVYTDCNSDEIVKFLQGALKTLKIDKNQVLFKFRALKAKDKLKEWEIG